MKRLKKFMGKLKVNNVDFPGTDKCHKHFTAVLSLFIWAIKTKGKVDTNYSGLNKFANYKERLSGGEQGSE